MQENKNWQNSWPKILATQNVIIFMTLSEDSVKLYIIIIKKWLPLDKTQALQFKNFGERNKRTFDDVIEIIIIMKNLSGLVLENPIQLDLLKE